MSKVHQSIRRKLFAWYDKTKRDLPWRDTKNPYNIWVSEIMLQQTQVKTVLPYYLRWIKTFPTVEKLAGASERKVLKLWEGLGYYSRARNLRKAAQIIVKDMNGKVPDTVAGLMALPGIGRYTAGAIASIAFGLKAPVLDGNVKRVLSRLFCLNENGATSASENRLWQKAADLLPTRRPGDFNQALMELGATVCTPKSPTCLQCPVRTSCEVFRRGTLELFPPAKKKAPAKKIEVSAAIILRNRKIYIQQRAKGGLMGGLWEFPGGKREKKESMEDCLRREIKEELGASITILDKVMTIKHTYTQFRVTLHVFNCRLNGQRLRPNGCEQWKWVSPAQLATYPFPAANVKIVEYLTDEISKTRD
ncbi:MAG: A/G-specific adenine glycosylase [Nitrospinaceae bacterium]|jgi:A/G-specific adenine glycosylase|nr:A/G-specific adenine glycosylase [Nitrospinaceae bacterium]|tara:strand:- start:1782 stop:2870 length:1089 start_codon:yes stop_codon:yes gene_type:complete